MRIGLAEEFANEARHAIARQEYARKNARAGADRGAIDQKHQQDEKAQPLKPRLVKL